MADESVRSDEGEAGWATTAPFVPRPEDVLDVDALLAEVDPLWRALETICVAGCCGLDAFDFEAETARADAEATARAAAEAEVARLRALLAAKP